MLHSNITEQYCDLIIDVHIHDSKINLCANMKFLGQLV